MKRSIREVIGHRHDVRAQMLREWAGCIREHRAADPSVENMRPVRVRISAEGWFTIWDDSPPASGATPAG